MMLRGCDEHAVISIENYEFHPDKLVVRSGTKVKWINRDNCVHNVATTDGSFISPDLEYGETFVKTMNSAKRFRYYCSIYPHMMGEIRVQQSEEPRGKKQKVDNLPEKLKVLKNLPKNENQKKTGASFTVRIREWKHLPARVQINVGDTVVWVTDFDDSTPYVLQCHVLEFQSTKLSNGASFAFQFDNAGTFSVFDALYPHMSATEVKVSPQSTAPGLDDLEHYLKQWQTQADAERHKQLHNSMGKVKSRAAKFSAYLSSQTHALHSARQPLGSFASLKSGLRDVSGSVLKAQPVKSSAESNEVSVRPPSAKKKRPSKKMRKKLRKLRDSSSHESDKDHTVLHDNVATAQPSTGKKQMPTPTPKENTTAKTNETVTKPQSTPQSATQIRNKSSKPSNTPRVDRTILASAKERPLQLQTASAKERPLQLQTARRTPTRSNRPAPKNVTTTKVNSMSEKPRSSPESAALVVQKNSKVDKASAIEQIVQAGAKARTPKRHHAVPRRVGIDLSPDQNRDSTNCARPAEPVATDRVDSDRNCMRRREMSKSKPTHLRKPNNAPRRIKTNKFDVLAALNFLNSRYFEAISHSNRQ